jgi:transposase
MDFYSHLAHLNVPEPVSTWVQKSVDEMVQQAAQKTQELTQKLVQSNQQLAHLRRMHFGQRSEAFVDATQLGLFEQDLQADLAQARAAVEQASLPTQDPSKALSPSRRPNHPGRQTLPAHLPRVDVRHEPESLDCVTCKTSLNLIGEDITEQLEVKPASSPPSSGSAATFAPSILAAAAMKAWWPHP